VPPTREIIPKICNVSMIGNSHSDSRIAVPVDVWLSHLQKTKTNPIPETLADFNGSAAN
jgi:hypothetical protein